MAEPPFTWSRADQELFLGLLSLMTDRYDDGAPGTHVTLEDGNLDDDTIDFDIRQAEAGENFVGVAVLKMLRKMPFWLRREAWDDGFSIAFDCLRSEGRIVELT